MPTNRRPIPRPPRTPRFTAAALEAFKQMRQLKQECTCEPIDWDGKYWDHEECDACKKWTEQKRILHRELQLKPWERTVQHPNAVSPYPEGSYKAKTWKPDHAAQERYRELEAALKQQERTSA